MEQSTAAGYVMNTKKGRTITPVQQLTLASH